MSLIDRLDNDVTKLYKYASKHRVPEDLIFLEDGEYVSLFEKIRVPVEDVMGVLEEVKGQLGDIDIHDLVMGYYRENLIGEPSDLVVRQLNQLSNLLGVPSQTRYPSIRNVKQEYEAWTTSLTKSLLKIDEETEYIERTQALLVKMSKNQSLKITDPKIFSATFSFHPTFESRTPNPRDGMEIFDQATPSIYAPFIAYRSFDGNLTPKIYKGKKFEDKPNYETTVIPDALMLNADHIYMNLWLADLSKDPTLTLYDSPREFFRQVSYNLVTNTLVIETPIEPSNRVLEREEDIFERIREALHLELGEPQRTKLHAEMYIMYEGKKIEEWFDEMSLADVLINDEYFAPYFYMEENFTPFAFKKKLLIYYKSLLKKDVSIEEKVESNYASVSAWYTKRETTKDQRIVFLDVIKSKTKTVDYDAGQEYLSFSITNAESQEVLNQFMLVFKLIMEYYLTIREDILAYYKSHLGDYQISSVKSTANRVGGRTSKSGNLQKLKEQAPEIFVKGYSTPCQANYHPRILNKEEEEEYVRKGRDVITFPINPDPGQKQYVMGCPGDDRPHIGVFANKIEINNGKFPYLPCCYQKDHIHRPTSAWAKYVEGVAPTKINKGAKADKKLVTNKFLSEGSIGYLPKSVSNILEQGSTSNVEYSRFGVIRSPSSLLHCVLYAIGDEEYMRRDEKGRIKYVSAARRWMAENVYPGLLKQQMYDYQEAEITDYLLDEEQFLDPNYVYRAIEVLFELNLYTFSPPPPGDEGGVGEFELPRFSSFLCKSHNPSLPTLLLLRTTGAASDKLKYPQMEFIVASSSSTFTTLFDKEFGEYCYGVMRRILNTKYSRYNPQTRNISTYDDTLFSLDYSSIFNLPIEAQHIDTYGKMRGLNLRIGKDLYTVMTPPGENLNLPITSTIYVSNGSFMKGFKLVETKEEGRYYKLVGDETVLVPSEVPFDETPVTDSITYLKKTLYVYKQVLLWVYSKYKGTIENFFRDSVIVDEEYNSWSYEFKNLKEKFPNSQTSNDALSYLSTVTNFSRRIKGDKYSFIAYSERFKESLQSYLKNAYRKNQPIVKLRGYYRDPNNFIQHPNSQVFVNRAQLDDFVSRSQGTSDKTKTILKTKYDKLQDPYIYSDVDGKIYIVQNCNGGFFEIALTIGYRWSVDQYNPGFNGTIDEVEGTDVNGNPTLVNIYAISPEGTLELVDQKGEREENEKRLLRVLYYGSTDSYLKDETAKYASLLEVI